MIHTAGIVLCGGQSRRMGRPKAWLPFGPETMLQRVVRQMAEAVDVVCVVAAADQPLPPLPAGVLRAHDRAPQRGPLEGMAAGLTALAGRAEAVVICGCDLPLLRPALVRRLFALLDDTDAIVVPHIDGRDEPLLAVYRGGVLKGVEELLSAGRRRPLDLFKRYPTRRVRAEELADADPELESLFNVNTPDAHQAALRRAGLALP